MNQEILNQLPQLVDITKTVGTETFKLTVEVLWWQAAQVKFISGLYLLVYAYFAKGLFRKTMEVLTGDADSVSVAFSGFVVAVAFGTMTLFVIPAFFEFIDLTSWYGLIVNPNVLAVIKFLH